MSDDIVTLLRRGLNSERSAALLMRESADEIERLRRNIGCARGQRTTQFCAEALDAQRGFETLRAELGRNADALAATIRELRKVEAERDEARREIAMLCAPSTVEGLAKYADARGWDCFKEDGK